MSSTYDFPGGTESECTAMEQQTSNWQPIDTAPTDGTTFDGWGYCIPDSAEMPIEAKPSRHTECYWGVRDSHYVSRSRQPHMGRDGWCSQGPDGWSWAMVLTHWMPEPAPPHCP